MPWRLPEAIEPITKYFVCHVKEIPNSFDFLLVLDNNIVNLMCDGKAHFASLSLFYSKMLNCCPQRPAFSIN
jgi:hypothetical protein